MNKPKRPPEDDLALLQQAYQGVEPLVDRHPPHHAPSTNPVRQSLRHLQRLQSATAAQPKSATIPLSSRGQDANFQAVRSDLGFAWLRKRRRKLQRPEATLDLHGHQRAEAIAALWRFIEVHRQRGSKALLIIVGKGHHSTRGESVLRPVIEEELSQHHQGRIDGVTVAPVGFGGSGALLVFLRQ